ncbi:MULTISPECIES: Gfo/Idh/MocA family oxidoreductase [Streptomyces]|uniref:Gfo/Idh/MocA-like oxidoreductase N-terminal domain-containing protein n=1 Tax=Streptomyces sudanensis TaxID=436397 RepID=A0ABY4TKM5_9ACTN|nr:MULTISPECIES: Gfo/Idh/MocA family oxidoreductase [Streptomyces]URN17560.1 hypothetical protein MW084_18280 [Streptomyces sudanensis]
MSPERAAGRFVEHLLPVEDAEPVAVGPRSAGSARLFAARYSVPRAYGSHQDLLACPHVDIVYVAAVNSAHGWHCAWSRRPGSTCCARKDLATAAAEAGEPIDLAGAGGSR